MSSTLIVVALKYNHLGVRKFINRWAKEGYDVVLERPQTIECCISAHRSSYDTIVAITDWGYVDELVDRNVDLAPAYIWFPGEKVAANTYYLGRRVFYEIWSWLYYDLNLAPEVSR